MAKRISKKRRRLAALKGWRTRLRNIAKRRKAALRGWRVRRRRERARRKPRREIREVRGRPAFLLREQIGEQLEREIAQRPEKRPVVKEEISFMWADKDTGEFHEEVFDVEFETPKPIDEESKQEFWDRFHKSIRDELEAELDRLDEDGIDYEDLSVTISSFVT